MRPIVPLAVHHETFSIDDFAERLPELKARGESMMFYIFPFENLITVEFRKYNPGAKGDPDRMSGRCATICGPLPGPRSAPKWSTTSRFQRSAIQVLDGFCASWRFKLENLVRSENTVAADQIIRYPPVAGDSQLHFQPVRVSGSRFILPCCQQYFEFCTQYYKATGYRINMLCVGYRIAKDRNVAALVLV